MTFDRLLSRRAFLRLGLTTVVVAAIGRWRSTIRQASAEAPPAASTSQVAATIPTRTLGKTGIPVTIVGLGGEGVLRTWNRHNEATAIIRRALEQGITYCDTAPAYSASQDYYGEALGTFRNKIFLASKTHDRTRDGSLRLLEQSLKRLRTDHLDLWQLHNLNTVDELDAIFSKDGAIHALEQAKREGLVRFLGITGHYDPAVLVEAIRRYPFDTVLVALNVADRFRLSFIEELLPVANEHGLGIIGMKVFAKGELFRQNRGFSASQALSYVLSLPISTAIVGFSSVAEVDETVESSQRFEPFPEQEMARLAELARPFAERLSWFKRGNSA